MNRSNSGAINGSGLSGNALGSALTEKPHSAVQPNSRDVGTKDGGFYRAIEGELGFSPWGFTPTRDFCLFFVFTFFIFLRQIVSASYPDSALSAGEKLGWLAGRAYCCDSRYVACNCYRPLSLSGGRSRTVTSLVAD